VIAEFEKLVDAAPYGVSERLSPLVRRVLARNPSAFTFTGSGTYIVGEGAVAVIDPGPADDAHIAAILAATEGERIAHILITHTHLDHSPGAVPLKAATDAPVAGCAPLMLSDSGPRADAGFDPTYAPDQVLADGEQVSGPGWTLIAVHTPGHTSNHLCYALAEEGALFTGDHVMGWSTTVVSPPDGDMDAYLASLDRVAEGGFRRLYPTHGAPIEEPAPFIAAYKAHRLAREAQVLARLQAGDRTIPDMVRVIYADVDAGLHPAACHSALAHMIRLERQGLVRAEAGEGVGAVWRLTA
jgi:glyoxylase-like metal-dependent hydrolase (beta-lactamase superfamily II)